MRPPVRCVSYRGTLLSPVASVDVLSVKNTSTLGHTGTYQAWLFVVIPQEANLHLNSNIAVNTKTAQKTYLMLEATNNVTEHIVRIYSQADIGHRLFHHHRAKDAASLSAHAGATAGCAGSAGAGGAITCISAQVWKRGRGGTTEDPLRT